MARITITIDGLTQATQYFSSQLPADIQAAAKDTVSKIATDIYDTAKSQAAVDTGFMRDHIKKTGRDYDATVISEAEYSTYVDEGTSKMDAQPFLKEQAEQKLGQFHSKLEQEISRKIKR